MSCTTLVNQRKFIENRSAKWCKLFDNTQNVTKLCDRGITRFWDDHTENLSMEFQYYTINTKSNTNDCGINISNIVLEDGNTNIQNCQLYLQPHMEYAIGNTKSNTIKLYARRKLKEFMDV
jgi:hypothetical protein